MKNLTRPVAPSRILLPLLLWGGCSFAISVEAVAQDQVAPAPSVPMRLVEVGHERATGPLIFDMGVLEQLDNTQSNADFAKENEFMSWQPGYHRVLPGAKHIFLLKNGGTSDLHITKLETHSICVQAELSDTTKGQHANVVKAGGTVGVLVAFNQYMSLQGPVREAVDVFAEGSTTPVATLVMQGKVKGGIDFLESGIDFGKGQAGGRSREFTLTFDKRVPMQMTPAPLKLISSNRFVSIVSLNEGQTVMGVKVQNGRMSVPMDKPFPSELRLRFRAVLSDQAPVGAITGQINLIMVGAPYAAITRNLGIPLKGEVTK